MIKWLSEFFSVIAWDTWAWLFTSYFFLNILYTVNAIDTYKLRAVRAANTGVFIYVLAYMGISDYLKNPNNIIPILIASWLGEYLTIIYEIYKQGKPIKDKGKRNKKSKNSFKNVWRSIKVV